MKYRELAKLLAAAGFESRDGKGDHEVWTNGREVVVISQTREVSPGLEGPAGNREERTVTAVNITAKRWRGGWELWHGDEAWTQVAVLPRAADQVRDYLDTIEPDVDHSTWVVNVTPDLGDLGDAVIEARAATVAASAASIAAARQARSVAHRLRDEGYSVTDSAALLGVSRGRVSQLIAAADR